MVELDALWLPNIRFVPMEGTFTPADTAGTLCSLVPHAAATSPSSGLIDFNGTFLDWVEIEKRVNGLAAALVRCGVSPGERVCVAHRRSTASFVAVHAILRAGGVMVPLDPTGPPAAIATVIDAVEPTTVIGDSQTLSTRLGGHLGTANYRIVHNGSADVLEALGVEAARLVELTEAMASTDTASLPTPQPEDAAYIIFTSGSTGQPKGIVHTHASGLAYARMGALAHGMTPTDVLAASSPLHFDMSTLDLYGVPWTGASAIAISEVELRFPANLTKRLAEHRATMIYTTPYQLLQMQNRGDLANRDLASLRQIAFGGEAFAPGALVELGQAFPPAELLNVYGPAEVNGVTTHSFGTRPTQIDEVSIGRACPGVEVRIVDASDQVVTSETSGEMLVHSPTMMRGYWRSDNLDDQCFAILDGRRFYRTGDLAHFDQQGLLQFDGRRDNRIKVRGVRIELEEIERVLEDAPDVLHAIAGQFDDDAGVQQIRAWVVPPSDDVPDRVTLATWCRERLPASAVPTRFTVIDSVPTTATGKIDRATLRATKD